MANIPLYQPSIQAQDPGVTNARVEPMTPASSATNIAEAESGLGKEATGLGAHLLMSGITLDRIHAQQQGSDAANQYNEKLQQKLSEIKQRKGWSARGASAEMEAFIRGTPSGPGVRGQASPMDEFVGQLGEKAKTSFLRTAYSHNLAARGQARNHEVTEIQEAVEVHATSQMDDLINKGHAITNPDDLKKQQESLGKIFDTDQYWPIKAKGDQTTLSSLRQGFLDHQAEAAVKTTLPKGWQQAQSLLDAANVSPGMKASLAETINGARTAQTSDALTQAIVTDKTGRFRTPTGEIDESNAQSFIDNAISNARKTGLPAGHDNMIAEKVRSALSMRNSEQDQQKKLALENSADKIWGSFKQGVPSEKAYKDLIENGTFANAIERAKAEEKFKSVYSHDANALESLAETWSPERHQAYTQAMDSKEVSQKFPLSGDKKVFGDSLRQQIIEKNIHSRDGINQLVQDNLKSVPSGEVRWPINPVGWVMGREHTADYADLAMKAEKNQALVKAVGGTAQAVALAQNIGGIDKLAPDTDEAKAVMALIQRGAKPEQIRSDSIEAVKKKHPDWIK